MKTVKKTAKTIGSPGGSIGSTSSSSSSPKHRGMKKAALAMLTSKRSLAKVRNLTPLRLTKVIEELGDTRGSNMIAIRRKLDRSGYPASTAEIRTLLERAMRSGMLREVRDERYVVLKTSGTGSASMASATDNSRVLAKVARRKGNMGQDTHYHHCPVQAVSTASRASTLQLQGPQHANNDESSDEELAEDTGDDDDDDDDEN